MKKEVSFEDVNDTALVREIVKSNNTMLFAILYDRYAKIVYNKCYGFANSQAEAEDLTQDVFLMLFVKLGSFKGQSKFSTWLYSFTYNFCVNYVQRDKHKKNENKTVVTDQVKDEEVFDEIDDAALFELKADKLAKAMSIIEPNDKMILMMKYQDDLSIKEISEGLEIGESAVKMRLKRAKEKVVKVYNEL